MQGYAQQGETSRVLSTIKTGADYLTACHVSDEQFVVQIGNYVSDSADLHSPEYMTQARPVYLVNASSPGESTLACLLALVTHSLTQLILLVPRCERGVGSGTPLQQAGGTGWHEEGFRVWGVWGGGGGGAR